MSTKRPPVSKSEKLFSKIMEVLDATMVGEVKEQSKHTKKLVSNRKGRSGSLSRERSEIAKRLKAVQSHWDEIDDEGPIR